ncbi:MAG: PDZ domain-containing protein [Syntrophomonadaceae bacterium]
MESILMLLALMGQKLLEIIVTPLFLGIYLLLFVLVAWQYKRLEDMSGKLLNTTRRSYLGAALVSTLLGLAGGLLGSVLLILVGIDLLSVGIIYLWIMALLLMFINQRFLCFAYAGGLLSLLSLLLGYPDIDIPQLLALVAVLHMVESLLIMANGHLNPVPVYVKKGGHISGGFNLQKFWPMPLIALISIGYMDIGSGGVSMPDWWPLIKGYSPESAQQVYVLMPVLAILGYGEITTTSSPGQKARESALYLFMFSLILLLLSLASSRWAPLLWLAALFSPLGHEMVIWMGMRSERNRHSLYVRPAQGVMILDVRPGTPAAQAGLRSRDIVLQVNGMAVNHPDELANILQWAWQGLQIKILRAQRPVTLYMERRKGGSAGIIPVPEDNIPRYLVFKDDTIFLTARRWWRCLKKRLSDS